MAELEPECCDFSFEFEVWRRGGWAAHEFDFVLEDLDFLVLKMKSVVQVTVGALLIPAGCLVSLLNVEFSLCCQGSFPPLVLKV